MTETVERVEDRLADFTRDKRILLLSAMAVVIGGISAFVAKALVWLIAVFTNLTFYQRFSSDFVSPTNHHLGVFVILAPVGSHVRCADIATARSWLREYAYCGMHGRRCFEHGKHICRSFERSC